MNTTTISMRGKSALQGFAVGLTWLVAAGSVHADGYRAAVPILPAYGQECAACHMAYPPSLLPAASWQRLMRGLDQHYGTNASLDEATVITIGNWLTSHAAGGKRAVEPPQDRITQSQWFVRKHRQFNAADWAHPQIKTASNCVACHAGAERGNFEEDEVRLPDGVGRAAWTRLMSRHD